jgi:hypothetical protein
MCMRRQEVQYLGRPARRGLLARLGDRLTRRSEPAATLPGTSRTVRVEPLEVPQRVEPEPVPAGPSREDRPPAETPATDPEREREPAGTP